MFSETVLALMLMLGTPGKTLYSSVDVEEDARPVVLKGGVYVELEDGEELPYACKQRGNVACRKPRFHKPRNAWVRTETHDEGMKRWWMIARAIAKHTHGDTDAAMRLVVTSRHESGWWRDVHAGYNHRPYVKKTKFEDSGLSWGLFQLLSSRNPKTKISGTELVNLDIVGVTDDNTGKATKVAAWHFSTIVKRCKKRGAGATCWWLSYGGVTNPKDKRIRARVSSWMKLKRSKPEQRKLSKDVRKLLGLKPKEDTPKS